MTDSPYSLCESQSSSGGENVRRNSQGLRVICSSFGQNIHDMLGLAAASQHTRTLSAEQFDKVSRSNLCAICLEDMDEENGEIFTIPLCKHKFHEGCVRLWKKEKATCPSCRGVMPEELGLTDEHIWIGDRLLTFNSRPPPETTIYHVCCTTMLAPLGFAYSLFVVFLCIVFEFIFLVFLVFFFVLYALWYSWFEAEDVSWCGRIVNAVISFIAIPFLYVALVLIWISHLRVLFCKLVIFYKNVMTCQSRWTDIFLETVIPAIHATETLLNEE